MRTQLQNRQATVPLDRDVVVAPDSVRPTESLEERRARARRLQPPAGIKCRDCWLHGRDAAILAAAKHGLEAVATAEPAAREYQHDRAVWELGRTAVLDCLTA